MATRRKAKENLPLRGTTEDVVGTPQRAQRQASEQALLPELASATTRRDWERVSKHWALQGPRVDRFLLSEALRLVKTRADSTGRAKGLATLAPYLTQDQLGEALATASDSLDESDRAELLAALGPYLTANQFADALASARMNIGALNRSRALAALVPHLPAEQRHDVLSEALASANAIDDERGRSAALDALRSLAPQQFEQFSRDQEQAAAHQESDRKVAIGHFESGVAGEIILIGDAPKRYDDFLGRAELAFIVAARLNGIWDEMNPRTGIRPPVATRLRRALNSIRRRSWRVWHRFVRRKVKRASKRIIHRTNATLAYDAGFVVHLDAPWGGGKTTFANYLASILNPYAISGKPPDWLTALPLTDNRYWPRAFRRPWQIVTFSAWQHQHVDPPWWCFYQAVWNQSSSSLLHETNAQAGNSLIPAPEAQFGYRGRVQRAWKWLAAWTREITWRLLTPQIQLSAFVTLGAIGLAVSLASLGWVKIDLKEGRIGGNFAEVSGTLAVILATLIGGGSFIWTVVSTFTATLLTGTPDAAKNYSLGSGDPLERFRTHFAKMVERLRRPVLVIVDDIDRCEPRFVVELIRGMQTILKSPRIVFLLLGDGDWIEQSFAETHKAMKEIRVGPQHTFGRRFVEKAIQLSLMLPDISTDERPTYVRKLLGMENTATEAVKALPEEQQKRIEETLQNLEAQSNPVERDTRAASLRDEVSRFPISPDLKDAVTKSIDRKVALRSAADERVSAATRHRLEPIAAVLPPNPRQIKRIINSISLFQEIARIRMGVQPDTREWQRLALWIVLMIEWPQTWTTLATWPDLITRVLDEKDKSSIDGLDESTIQAWVGAIRSSREMMFLLDFPSLDKRFVPDSWRHAGLDADAIRTLKLIIPVSGKALARPNSGRQESGTKAPER